MPRRVEGPVHNPFADVRWNAAEVRVERDGPAEPVLLSTPLGDANETFVVSHNALPEHRDLFLDVFRRTDAPRRRVQLERFMRPGHGEVDARLCSYRLRASVIDQAPTTAPPAAAVVPDPRVPRASGFDALPSTY